MKEIDTTERHWREHLTLARDHATALAGTVMPDSDVPDDRVDRLVGAVYHLTEALAGLTEGDPKVSRWQPLEQLQPAPGPAADEYQRHLERAEGY